MSRAIGRLVNAQAVADLLGVSRQRVHQLIDADPLFPAPIANLGGRRVWEQPTIEEWAIEVGRICPEHHHVAIGKQVVAGRLVGRCKDDFLYEVPANMVPGEPGPNARAPKLPVDFGKRPGFPGVS